MQIGKKSFTAIYLALSAVLIFSFQNCGYVGPSNPSEFMLSVSYSSPPTFAELDAQIFQPKCLSCHSSGSPNFSSYDTLMANGGVVANDPNQSSVYQQVAAKLMPKGGAALSSDDEKAIYDWIAAGASSGGEGSSTAPDSPSSVSAMATSATSIMIVWTLPVQAVTGVKVERAAASTGPFAVVANIATAATSYSDIGLSTSTAYYYRVSASNLVGESIPSAIVNASTSAYPPSAPTSLSATPANYAQIDLTWTDTSSDETGFRVERSSSSSGPFSLLATLSQNTNSYSDTSVSGSSTFYYRVLAYSSSSGNSSYSNTTNATTPSSPPSAPSGLAATAISSSQINLSWTDNSNNETGFRIERGTSSSGPFVLINTTSANATSFSDSGLSGSTTYYYRIYAWSGSGNSAYSLVANATTAAPVPLAPTSLVATAISAAAINLTWADNSTIESGFKVERGLSASGPFTVIFTSAANITNYSDTGLNGATTYHYRVYAFNGGGNSAYSSVVNATTLTAVVPTAPSGLSAGAVSSMQINLNWTDNSSNENGFKIERGTASSGPFSLIFTSSPNATGYSDTGLSSSTTYYYRISATNSAGDSAYTTFANATTQAPPVVAPSAPSGLSATSFSPTQINLSWSDNSGNESGFKVERATSSGGPFSLIQTAAAGATSYSASGLTSSTTYYFRVSATNSAGDSAYTSVANASTQDPIPNVPTGLSASAVSSAQINLSWTDASSVETGFKIERATSSSGPFSLIYTAAANATNFSDTLLSGSTTYYYRILSFNATGESAYTATANATTLAPAPVAPSNLSATATSASQVSLSWTDNSNSESGFRIERAISSSGPFSLVYTSAANVTSYADSGLPGSTTYYYRAYAFNASGNSAYTSVVSVTTQAPAPSAPSSLVATASSSSQINLSWVDNSNNEMGFRIERATSATGPFTLVATLGANLTSYNNTGLSAATTYYFRVYAYSGAGNSSYSSTASSSTYGTYSLINTNIVQAKCISCHSGGSAKGGYEMSNYTGVMTGVVSGNSSGSLFYQRVLDGTMPKGLPNLTSSEMSAIRTWIDSGAPNN